MALLSTRPVGEGNTSPCPSKSCAAPSSTSSTWGDTGMNRRNFEHAGDPDAVRARWLSVTPLGRMGTPEEIARTVLYLESDQSSFTTRIGRLIDGGRVGA